MSNHHIVSDLAILRQVSSRVETVEEAKEIIAALTSVLGRSPDGIGLSGVQIGILKQVSVIRTQRNGIISLINPVVVEESTPFIFNGEGCLSFPGVYESTNRFREFVIKNMVIDGDSFREELQYYYYEPGGDLEAIVAQHEIDHLSGVLFFDKKAEVKVPQLNKAKVGRNDPCPCGSGKKYKKCCS